MTIYIVLWISIIICCFLEVNFKAITLNRVRIETRRISFIFLYLFILLMGIFRQEIFGVDVYNYKSYFFEYGNMSFIDIIKGADLEKGYAFFNKLVYSFTKDFWIFKALLYFITFTLFSYVICKCSKYISISYLCYVGFGFLGFNFCILRQALAVSICFYSFKYIKEKKVLSFIAFVLIASLIHQTAVCYLLLYPIVNGIYKDRYGIKKILFIIMAFIIGNSVLPFLFQFGINDYSNRAVKGTGFNMLAFYIILIMGIGYLIKNLENSDLKDEYNSLFAIIFFQVDALFFSLISRMVNYFSVNLSITVPNLIFCYKKKNWLLICFILICSLMYYISLGSKGGTEIVPYISIFQNK